MAAHLQLDAQLDPQLASLCSLCAEIRAIAADASLPPSAEPPAAASLSYSFSLFDSPQQALASLVDSARELLAKLKPVATIHTTHGSLAAVTTVNYAGRATSAWNTFASAELTLVHLTAVERTLALRAALAESVAASAGALVAISASVANPLTALRVLAAANRLKASLQRLASAAEAAA